MRNAVELVQRADLRKSRKLFPVQRRNALGKILRMLPEFLPAFFIGVRLGMCIKSLED